MADDDTLTLDTAAPPPRKKTSRVPGPVALLRGTGKTASGAAAGAAKYAGRGMLEAELVVAIVIIAIRMVADYHPSDNGPQYKGTVVPPNGQLGPLSIFASLITVFIILSFASKRGGTTAKLAVILGGIIVLALAMKSWTQISGVAGALTRTTKTTALTTDAVTGAAFDTASDITFEEFGSSTGSAQTAALITQADPNTPLGSPPPVTGTTPSTTTTIANPNATGIFPTINPGGSITPAGQTPSFFPSPSGKPPSLFGDSSGTNPSPNPSPFPGG